MRHVPGCTARAWYLILPNRDFEHQSEVLTGHSDLLMSPVYVVGEDLASTVLQLFIWSIEAWQVHPLVCVSMNLELASS